MLMRRLLASLLALFAFPTLTVLTIGLAGSSVFVVVAAFLRQFGVNIGMNLALFEVPKGLSIPVGLLFAVVFFYLARQSWRLLRISYETVIAVVKG